VKNSRSQPRIPARAALSFQGGIGIVGLAAILLFSIPVHNEGLGVFPALLWGIVGSLATYVAIITLTRMPGLPRDSLDAHMAQLHRFACDYSWPVLVALSVLAGVGEELLFRGAIQGWLSQFAGTVTAVLVASLLFGLVHYLSFTYFVVASCLGLVLGAVYAFTDSLLLVMVWHAVYDMIALYSLRRYPHLFGIQNS
jgi:membrane protease YdiL (CAAX protease family)